MALIFLNAKFVIYDMPKNTIVVVVVAAVIVIVVVIAIIDADVLWRVCRCTFHFHFSALLPSSSQARPKQHFLSS